MNMKNWDNGFTLIEVLIIIFLIGILIFPIYSANIAAWNFWELSRTKIDLQQQARIISMYLDENIRSAIKIELKDEDMDGNMEKILINLGQIEGSTKNYYLQYSVVNNKLGFKESEGEYSGWPPAEDWSSYKYITEDIIDNEDLFNNEENSHLITYKIVLSDGSNSFIINKKIHPRISN